MYIKIEEVGVVNFFGIMYDNVFIILYLLSILLSIIKKSLMVLVKEYLNFKVEEREILMDELGVFREVGVCGIVVIIMFIKEIMYNNKFYFFEVLGNIIK